MNLPKRLRNIALSQINSIKDRLDRIDTDGLEEAAEKIEQARYRRDALEELNDPTNIKPILRTPEEIAKGLPASSASPGGSRPPTVPGAVPSQTSGQRPPSVPSLAPASSGGQHTASTVQAGSALAAYYKVLNLEDGADFASVQSAYNKLVARCDPARFTAGSEDQKMAEAIRKRVDAAYESLRDALDSTAGRFDKLEFE